MCFTRFNANLQSPYEAHYPARLCGSRKDIQCMGLFATTPQSRRCAS